MKKLFGIITAALVLCGLGLSGADKPAPAKKKPLPVSEFLRHFEKTDAGKETGVVLRVFDGEDISDADDRGRDADYPGGVMPFEKREGRKDDFR